MTKPKMGMSFDERRKEMAARMAASAKGNVETKSVSFKNRDVPEFLKKLDAFEKKSRKSQLRIN